MIPAIYSSEIEMAKKKTALQNRLRLVKVPTMAYLDPEQATALRELSAKSGKPMQSYLREGVDLVIEKYRGERK
jgi:Ribbon-helix-helix domain